MTFSKFLHRFSQGSWRLDSGCWQPSSRWSCPPACSVRSLISGQGPHLLERVLGEFLENLVTVFAPEGTRLLFGGDGLLMFDDQLTKLSSIELGYNRHNCSLLDPDSVGHLIYEVGVGGNLSEVTRNDSGQDGVG
jgi:hypothetical protein